MEPNPKVAVPAEDPPLGICPAHPTRNAWRVCSRCGRFLCALCTHPTPKGPFCPECTALTPATALSIGGWLVLPLFSLLFNAAFNAYSLHRSLSEAVSFEGAS